MNPKRKLLFLFFASLLAGFSGCDKPRNAAPPQTEAGAGTSPTVAPAVDVCSLLTSKEIEAIQGEEVQRVQESGKSEGELASAQCAFILPSLDKSISLLVVGKGNTPGGRDVKSAWNDLFPPEILRERQTATGKPQTPPRRIPGMGEEAFWLPGPAGGLYVLGGNHYLFLSIGGADDEETKIGKCSALARLIVKRLGPR